MIKEAILLLFFLSFISSISASCNSTQININTANSTELDKIAGIGPAYAEKIISFRPFSSLDDLLNVKGIGNKTLDKIKSQGLACVNDAYDKGKNIQTDRLNNSNQNQQILLEDTNVNISLAEINAQSIKTNNENGNKSYAIYGLIGFCILLSALFAVKFRKRRKNEFR